MATSISALPLTREYEPWNPSCIEEAKMESYTEPAVEKPPKPPTPLVKAKPFPLAFVLAVAIDSSLDGLLIGIASVAGPSAGPMMSASLSVEMSFLGITLATKLSGQRVSSAALAALVGPMCCKSTKRILLVLEHQF